MSDDMKEIVLHDLPPITEDAMRKVIDKAKESLNRRDRLRRERKERS
jgi:hypothetical protein